MTTQTLIHLAQQLSQQLLSRHEHLVTIESCTGGLLAAMCTELSGSSQWFERGYITYSNAAKIAEVHVRASTLENYGAVSDNTAAEMASGALQRVTSAQLALSVTGVAGPTGGSIEKPVGMVCFGLAHRCPDAKQILVFSETQHFKGDRAAIREQSVAFALTKALNYYAARATGLVHD